MPAKIGRNKIIEEEGDFFFLKNGELKKSNSFLPLNFVKSDDLDLEDLESSQMKNFLFFNVPSFF